MKNLIIHKKALKFFKNKIKKNHSDKKENNNVGIEAELKVFPGFKIKKGIIKEIKLDSINSFKNSSEQEVKKIDKILKEKGGKIIFNGKIEDTRYDNIFFKNNGIFLIRVRHLIGKELNKTNHILEKVDKYQLTIKTQGKNKAENNEFEKDYSKKEIDNIIKKFNLTPYKIYKKSRKEYEIGLNKLNNNKTANKKINNRKIKIALDNYKNYKKKDKNNKSIIYKDYKIINKFIEIESGYGVKDLTKTVKNLGLKNRLITTSGPKILEKFFYLRREKQNYFNYGKF